MKNLERYKRDLAELFKKGTELRIAIRHASFPEEVERTVELAQEIGLDIKQVEDIPSFSAEYQLWYSEASAVVRQLLPDRLEDFHAYYQAPKNRKEVTLENYRISDFLSGYRVTEPVMGKSISGPKNVLPLFEQQFHIVKSVDHRLQSSLFDIKQLARADLFDSELEAARDLMSSNFLRPAGVMAGVVMERHLAQVCENHAIETSKKKLTINDFNDNLKNNDVIDTAEWRRNQYLGDLRNSCAHHNDEKEVAKEQVEDLIDGVTRLIKTLF